MNEIYYLVGKIVKKFQLLEKLLEDFVFISRYRKEFSAFENLDKKTLGQILTEVKDLKIFSKTEDIEVLEYIKNKRNYIVHEMFCDDKLKELSLQKKYLRETYKEIVIIEEAIINMLWENLKMLK